MLLNDKNGDGALTFDEMVSVSGLKPEEVEAKRAKFAKNDRNNDGILDKDELFALALDIVKA